MGTPLSYAAGGASDALQEQLKQMFLQQLERAKLAQEDRRIENETAYRKQQQASMDEARASTRKLQQQTLDKEVAGNLQLGQEVTPDEIGAAQRTGMGNRIKGATLASRNIGAGMMSTPNPGKGATFQGTAEQQQEAGQNSELERQIAMAATPALRGRLSMAKLLPPDKRATAISETMREEAKPPEHSSAYKEYQDAVASGYKGDFNKYQTDDANRKKSAPAMITVHTVDAAGNNVTKVVPKTAGSEFAAPVNATTANRVASAETVNRLSDDMLARLADPKLASTLGVVMGRYNTLQDFIGAPPPEFAELAGEVESFALANMGVHGMRSAFGAKQISDMLNQKQTPESLAAKIRGLSKFSKDFAEHNKPTTGGKAPAQASGGTETPEQRIKRLLGGG